MIHIKLFEEYKKHKYTVNICDVFDYITSKKDWDSYKEEKFLRSLLLNKEIHLRRSDSIEQHGIVSKIDLEKNNKAFFNKDKDRSLLWVVYFDGITNSDGSEMAYALDDTTVLFIYDELRAFAKNVLTEIERQKTQQRFDL